MRIHSDHLTGQMIDNAFRDEVRAGRIASQVRLGLWEKGSRSHANAFEIQMTAGHKEDGDGRRLKNSGYYGAGEDYAPTYDEWGWLIAALYNRDRDAVMPHYADHADFNIQTGLTYQPARLMNFITNRGEDPYPFYTSRTGGQAGGLGRARSDGERVPRTVYDAAVAEPGKLAYGWLRYAPRTVADVQAYAKLVTA